VGEGRASTRSEIAMPPNSPDEVLAAWETSSQYWNKHQAAIEQMFAPLTSALIQAAHIQPGETVLDVGGGSGQPSLTIARLVGNEGSVIYTDPASGMVSTARDEAQRRQLTNIQFHQAAAEHLPLPDDHCDVAVGRLAVMFFPNVPAGLREILRVVRPGGHVAFLVWSAKKVNPFFSSVTDVLDQFVPPEPEDEDAPGAFRFARQRKLATLLREAGASSVREQPLSFRIEAPITLEGFWELRSEMSDTLRAKLATLAPDEIAKVRNAVEKAVAEYFESGEMNFPAQARVVSGDKPH
jgi:ubiquinone/menaquinone biosynthesis C-methylase UbiE